MSTHEHTTERAHLRHRRDELKRRRDQAMERVALFPNAVNRRHLDELTSELIELERKLADRDRPA